MGWIKGNRSAPTFAASKGAKVEVYIEPIEPPGEPNTNISTLSLRTEGVSSRKAHAANLEVGLAVRFGKTGYFYQILQG